MCRAINELIGGGTNQKGRQNPNRTSCVTVTPIENQSIFMTGQGDHNTEEAIICCVDLDISPQLTLSPRQNKQHLICSRSSGQRLEFQIFRAHQRTG